MDENKKCKSIVFNMFYNIYFVSALYTHFKRCSVKLITTELKWVGVLVAVE